MSRIPIGKQAIFVGYEDLFDGNLKPGERVVVYDVDGEDACRVHPVRNRRADATVTECVYYSELQPLPPIIAVG
ncbi:hypothetical protein GCM10011515_21530 [Tsuneonella deserti]|uniref:Uncharacterized protein n=1 Tax=Tsuneonella deserti TaxID=2035528 RepID=A0ABQ1SCB6_9SPHN|nr:hypothetical protein [Tsuneonella deserti]GGE01443.1 hypothetical protein GCM10011515_21530 [Tsuneonella deserti]